jgi:uncharacterized YigZ family protein
MKLSYLIATNEVVDETIVNRSRFICYLKPCTSAEEAKVFVKYCHHLHPQASHHCYAFVAGSVTDSQLYGFSDDGEPSGTAGRPMLSVLQGGEVGQVCAVVVRYFGGTKLGTGGLQRAYGGSVRQALTLLTSTVKVAMEYKTLACEYHQVNDILHFLSLSKGNVVEQNYNEGVSFTLEIPCENIEVINKQLSSLSAGQLVLKNID